MVVEISDGTYQARVHCQSAFTLPVVSTKPYITLSWNWTNSSAWYMQIANVAQAGVADNDIVLAYLSFGGATLNEVQYPLRPQHSTFATALGQSRFPALKSRRLKVEALQTPDMDFFVNGGYASYGSQKLAIPGYQATTEAIVITAPSGNPRIDLVWIDSGGNLIYEEGAEDPNPDPPTHTNKIALAEIRLEVGTVAITADMITDCRADLNLGGSAGLSGVLATMMLMGA